MTARWHLFCKVVDNFGDVGVCWRLARLLAHEHGADVTLVVDDLGVLARMAPGVERTALQQRHAGVTIARWTNPLPNALAVPEVVVEAFGCGLPDAYVEAMAAQAPSPAWFVLEYLSAEPWVDGAHGLSSPHPRLPLVRRFWFPGFTKATGGLPRERALFGARDAFQRDDAAQSAFWRSLGAPRVDGELRVSLFCYPHSGLPSLFDAWTDGDVPVGCVVPEGVASGALDAWTGGTVPHPGAPVTRGRLTLHAIPFVPQDDYDRLLWACDVNVVRGEDSFVRAQWAARPFVWHIYPQSERAHHRKIDAFLDRYAAALDVATATAVRRLFSAWNGAPGALPLDATWLEWAACRPQLGDHGNAWSAHLSGLPELASGLALAARDAV